MMNAMLKIVGGKHDGETISLITPKFLIGREQDCHLRPNSELVSRHHCVFTLDDYSLRIRDLGSTNGTIVNGERLEGEKTVKEGDRISVGKLEFEIMLTEASAVEQTEGTESVPSDTTELSGSETAHELPVSHPVGGETPPTGDTAVFSPQEYAVQQPGSPAPQPDPAYQQPNYGDQQPGYYPQQPGYYPQQPGYYPQQPGYYPQQPMAYPQQPGAYPPPAGTPQQTPSAQLPDVILPDPSTTGAKDDPPPKTDEEQSDESSKSQSSDPSQHAANLIKQHYRRGT